MSYAKDCGFFESKEEAEKIFPNFVGRDTCSFIEEKKRFMDNNNKCPPDCRFYPPRENYK